MRPITRKRCPAVYGVNVQCVKYDGHKSAHETWIHGAREAWPKITFTVLKARRTIYPPDLLVGRTVWVNNEEVVLIAIVLQSDGSAALRLRPSDCPDCTPFTIPVRASTLIQI